MLGFLTVLASYLQPILAFIIILVPLVVFHEFGHFIFAKIFGVKAEIFSVGFGPRLWWRQFGETELRISAIPMGGYVKLLGEDREAELSPNDLKRALHHQKPWKRFFIFFGGPLFNFLLAIFIFMVILAIGEPQLASVIGRVVHHSVAETAGFQSGDRILEINGKPVKKFEEVFTVLNDNPHQILEFKVVHPGVVQPVSIRVQTSSESGFSMYGEQTRVGEVDGLLPLARGTMVGISNPTTDAGKLGLETGDKIVEFAGRPVTSWEQIENLYLLSSPEFSILVRFEKGEKKYPKKNIQTATLRKPKASLGLGADQGLFSSELFVDKVVPKSPAEKIGLKTGDRLIGVGGQQAESFYQLREEVQKSGEKDGKVHVSWERDGRVLFADTIPTATETRDQVLNKATQYTVGIVPMLVMAEPETVVERILNPFRLVQHATERMVTLSWRNFVSLRKMFTGDVSMGSIAGPLMIGKIAGESLARGLIVFLTNMAIFSIGLGVLNILPIPVLDGGHLLLLGVECLRGKPLTLRQMEIVQGIGLVFILALMGIAFHNDIARLFYS